jgi:hypothetical protein
MGPEKQDHNHGRGFDHDTRMYGTAMVDGGLLANLMGAAVDGCATCQGQLITLLTQDAATTTRVVELACVAIQETFGGLPPNVLDEDPSGMTAPEFQLLARTGLDGENEAMWQECTRMTPEQRRNAANTALDLLAGMI